MRGSLPLGSSQSLSCRSNEGRLRAADKPDKADRPHRGPRYRVSEAARGRARKGNEDRVSEEVRDLMAAMASTAIKERS